MNIKTATLGISAAVIGGLAALVGAVAAGKGRPRPAPRAAGGGGETGQAASGSAAPRSAAAQERPIPGGPAAMPNAITPPPSPAPGEGHAAPDLAAGVDLGPDHRAPAAFRPDIDAPMTPAEREALRPPLGAPSLTGVSTLQPSGD